MKVTTLFTLLCASSTSAFVAPAARPAVQTSLQATTNKNQHFENLSNIATVAAATITTTVLSSPLAAIAESDDYEYGAGKLLLLLLLLLLLREYRIMTIL